MKRIFKIGLTILFSIGLLGCMTNTKRYHANSGVFQVSEYKGDCKISFTSNVAYQDYAVIDESMYMAFLKVVEDLDRRDCVEKIIMISSSGGSVSSAIKIGLIINQKGYSTSLQLGRGCSSACGIIFIAGKERIALTAKTGGNSAIGFHQISRNKVCSEPTAPEYDSIEKYANRVLPKNVTPKFVSLMKSTSCKSMSYVSALDLEKIGIATKVQPHPWGI